MKKYLCVLIYISFTFYEYSNCYGFSFPMTPKPTRDSKTQSESNSIPMNKNNDNKYSNKTEGKSSSDVAKRPKSQARNGFIGLSDKFLAMSDSSVDFVGSVNDTSRKKSNETVYEHCIHLGRRASIIVGVGFIPGILLLFIFCRYVPDWFTKMAAYT